MLGTRALLAFGRALLKRGENDPLDQKNDTHTGTNKDPAKNSSSIQALVATLVVNVAIFAIMVLIFIFLRRMFKKTYMPKTYITTVPAWKRKGLERIPGRDALLGWIWGLGKVEYVFTPH